MTIQEIIKYLVPIALILTGILLRYSTNKGLQKYWWVLVVIGILNLLFKIINSLL